MDVEGFDWAEDAANQSADGREGMAGSDGSTTPTPQRAGQPRPRYR